MPIKTPNEISAAYDAARSTRYGGAPTADC